MIKRKVTTDWIVRQIREGKAYRFYLTSDWQKVRDAKKRKNITNANAVVLWVSTALARQYIISYISKQDLTLLLTSTILSVFAKIATTKSTINTSRKN